MLAPQSHTGPYTPSAEVIEFLIDFALALTERYRGLSLHHAGGSVKLSDLPGHSAESLACQTDEHLDAGTPVSWRCVNGAQGRLVEIHLAVSPDSQPVNAWVTGDKSDELNISDILGSLKARYA